MTSLRTTLSALVLGPALTAALATSAQAQPAPAAPAPAPASASAAPAAAPSPPPAAPTTTLPASPPAPAGAAASPTAPAPGAAPASGPAAPQPLAPGSSQRVLGGPYPSSPAPYDGPPLLLGIGKPRLGAYAGFGVAYSHQLHRDGALPTLDVAVLVDHRLSIGASLSAFSRTPRGPQQADGVPRNYSTTYAGLLLRYAAFTDFPVYASLGLVVGGGAVALRDRYRYGDSYDRYDSEPADSRPVREQLQGYFVVQPDVSLHVNATRWLRFTAKGGYRFASAVERFGYDGTTMSGAVVGGNIEFGWF